MRLLKQEIFFYNKIVIGDITIIEIDVETNGLDKMLTNSSKCSELSLFFTATTSS